MIGAAAVDDSGQNDAGTDFFSVGDALAAGQEGIGVIGEIADGGDSSGEVEESVVVGDVGVHVPEAGKQSLAGGVNDFGVCDSALTIGSDAGDAVTTNKDILIGNYFPGFGVEKVGVGEQDSVGMMSEFGGEIGGAGLFDFILGGQQGWDGGFPTLGHDRAPIIDGGEELAGIVEPEISGREIESGGGVEGDVFFASGGFDVQFSLGLDATLAFRKKSYFSAVLQSGPRQESELEGARIEGNIVGGS